MGAEKKGTGREGTEDPLPQLLDTPLIVQRTPDSGRLIAVHTVSSADENLADDLAQKIKAFTQKIYKLTSTICRFTPHNCTTL
jgi:predicted AlkP superfamily phosphohydrolase/phosphomutase